MIIDVRGGHYHAHWHTASVYQDVVFHSGFGAVGRMRAVFFRPGASAHTCRRRFANPLADRIGFVVRQTFRPQPREYLGVAPLAETVIDGRPRAIFWRHLAPRRARAQKVKQAIEELAIIGGGTPTFTAIRARRYQRFPLRPEVIRCFSQCFHHYTLSMI